jgi:LacI family xylobiose transport system transcriptional regulator
MSTGSEGDATPRATLSEVAAVADVSISTVSKVLNGRPGVSDETRARVEALLHEQGYNRRQAAQSPAPLIEVLVYEIDSAWASELIAGVDRVSREYGLGMVVSGTTDRRSPDPRWIEGVLNRRPVGVLLVLSDLPEAQKRQLQARNIPYVLIDQAGSQADGGHSVGSADWSGAYAATRHLIELGHRRIAIITGPDDMMVATARLSGFRAALDSAGLDLPREYVRRGEFHHQDGLIEGRALLELGRPPTAVFASNDLQALGVYEAARALDMAVPQQVSVVGYDDLKIAGWAVPALTTVRVPLGAMAEEATRLIMRLRDEPGAAVSRIDLSTTLVVRDSTAAPPEGSAEG